MTALSKLRSHRQSGVSLRTWHEITGGKHCTQLFHCVISGFRHDHDIDEICAILGHYGA